MDETSPTTPRRSHVIIQTRNGAHYRVPIPALTEFSTPEGTVVIEWRPGRYLVMPPERLEDFRISDEELLPVALEAKVRARSSRPSAGGRRRARGARFR